MTAEARLGTTAVALLTLSVVLSPMLFASGAPTDSARVLVVTTHTPIPLNSIAWTQITTGKSTPSARMGAAMTYDAADGYVVLFGGYGLNDTWTYRGGVWTNVTKATAPSARYYPSMTYDPATRSVILFGGESWAASPTGCSGSASRWTLCHDTWSFSHGKWRILLTSRSPPAREGAAMAYLFGNGVVAMGGGFTLKGNILSDMWGFGKGSWKPISTSGPGAPFGGPTSSAYPFPMAFDGRAGAVIFYTINSSTGAETWDYNSTGWHLIPQPWHSSPLTDGGLGFDYDPSLRMVVLFGGAGNVGTWGYSGGHWANLSSGTSPPQGWYLPSMTYDAADSYTLVFGGGSPGNAGLFNQTWKLT